MLKEFIGGPVREKNAATEHGISFPCHPSSTSFSIHFCLILNRVVRFSPQAPHYLLPYSISPLTSGVTRLGRQAWGAVLLLPRPLTRSSPGLREYHLACSSARAGCLTYPYIVILPNSYIPGVIDVRVGVTGTNIYRGSNRKS